MYVCCYRKPYEYINQHIKIYVIHHMFVITQQYALVEDFNLFYKWFRTLNIWLPQRLGLRLMDHETIVCFSNSRDREVEIIYTTKQLKSKCMNNSVCITIQFQQMSMSSIREKINVYEHDPCTSAAERAVPPSNLESWTSVRRKKYIV